MHCFKPGSVSFQAVRGALFQAGECIVSGWEECVTSGRVVIYFKPGNVHIILGRYECIVPG